jgi:polyisoprenoid-binding protein YceI
MSTAESTSTAVQASPLPIGTWKVDPVHSSVEFQVKHLGIATVKGQFKEFEGTLEVTPDGGVRAYGTVATASVDTREPQRDAHLRSADFFDADQHPQITFQSTAVRSIDEESFEIEGDFTVHGITRPLKLIATLEGTETDHEGHPRVGISATAQISRADHDMKFNMALGSGNVVVGDKVKIVLDISAVKVD